MSPLETLSGDAAGEAELSGPELLARNVKNAFRTADSYPERARKTLDDVRSMTSALVRATIFGDREPVAKCSTEDCNFHAEGGSPKDRKCHAVHGLRVIDVDRAALERKITDELGRSPTRMEMRRAARFWPACEADGELEPGLAPQIPRQPGPAPRILSGIVVEYLRDEGIAASGSVDEIVRALVPKWIENLDRRQRAVDAAEDSCPSSKARDAIAGEADSELERRVLGDALRVAGLEDDRVHSLLRGPLKAKATRNEHYHFVGFVVARCTSISDVALAREVRQELGREPNGKELRAALGRRRKELAGFLNSKLPRVTADDGRALEVASKAVVRSTKLSKFKRAYEIWCAATNRLPILSQGRFAKALSTALSSCGGVTKTSATAPGGKRVVAFKGIGLKNT